MYNVLDRGVNMKEYTKNQVHEVACAFNEHKIIALPTDTVYGCRRYQPPLFLQQ